MAAIMNTMYVDRSCSESGRSLASYSLHTAKNKTDEATLIQERGGNILATIAKGSCMG